MKGADDGDLNNTNTLKENGLISGGIMVILFGMGLSIYSIVGLRDIFGAIPKFTFSMEPKHFE